MKRFRDSREFSEFVATVQGCIGFESEFDNPRDKRIKALTRAELHVSECTGQKPVMFNVAMIEVLK